MKMIQVSLIHLDHIYLNGYIKNDIYNIKEAKNITNIYTLHLVIVYITPDLNKTLSHYKFKFLCKSLRPYRSWFILKKQLFLNQVYIRYELLCTTQHAAQLMKGNDWRNNNNITTIKTYIAQLSMGHDQMRLITCSRNTFISEQFLQGPLGQTAAMESRISV